MYSIVQIGGHQYRVEPGTVLDVQKLDSEVGKDLTIDKVLFVGGEKPEVGKPHLSGAKVVARVIRQDRSRKEIVFKNRPGLWRKKKGHRQYYTSLLITAISDSSGKEEKIDNNHPWAKKFLSSK